MPSAPPVPPYASRSPLAHPGPGKALLAGSTGPLGLLCVFAEPVESAGIGERPLAGGQGAKAC